MEKVLVVDGNSIANRAFFGIRPLTTKSGLPTNAVYGFLTILKKHIDAVAPTRLVCAFDRKAPTFRHKMYDGYKATRKGMPDELAQQMPYVRRAAEYLGFEVFAPEGYEADDVLGTVSALGDRAGDVHTYILTGDRDSLQLVSKDTTVILAKTKEDVAYTPEAFRAEYGIAPEQFVDVKALMGDSSDNIPGVPGIGDKTALKLIAQAGSLDGVYAAPESLGLGKATTAKLIAGRDSAYMSKELATIFREVPLGTETPGSAAARDDAALAALFDELELTSLKDRFQVREASVAAQFQAPDFPEWSGEALPEGPVTVAFDAEHVAVICGETRFLLPFRGDAVAQVLAGREFVCHDYKYVYGLLKGWGVEAVCRFDTMLAAYLLNPGESNYSLPRLAAQFLTLDCREPTAGEQAHLISLLSPVLEKKLADEGMSALLTEIEIPLSEVLCEMEEAGFMLDAGGLHAYIVQLQQTADALADRIYLEAGREFNLNSPKQLGEVLFEDLGLPAAKKTKTGYATDAETLSRLRPYAPIIGDILDYRQLVKLCGTYGDNLISLAGPDGKIHSTFNQTGTATGRLSSADPNMQNIPVRGELGRELRKYFTASDGEHVLLDADYSQIELRLLAEISGDENMRNIFLSGGDIHRSTAAQVFRLAPEQVTPEIRARAKAVNFGIVYGIGEYSLSQDLNISRKAAKEYITSYLAAFPRVDAYLHDTVEQAHRDGYTTTRFGRRRPIPELSAKNKNLQAFGERVAMNSPIQGTAADIIKIAMIRTRRALAEAKLDAKLILQVHDELIVEVSLADADRAAEILQREMEHAVSYSIPLTAEVSRGFSWYEAKQ